MSRAEIRARRNGSRAQYRPRNAQGRSDRPNCGRPAGAGNGSPPSERSIGWPGGLFPGLPPGPRASGTSSSSALHADWVREPVRPSARSGPDLHPPTEMPARSQGSHALVPDQREGQDRPLAMNSFIIRSGPVAGLLHESFRIRKVDCGRLAGDAPRSLSSRTGRNARCTVRELARNPPGRLRPSGRAGCIRPLPVRFPRVSEVRTEAKERIRR